MSGNINTLSGERLSFYKLFCEKQYKISIPIIQRDYAQGRQTTSEVRTIFLDALYGYLEENKPNRDLDFVYGSLNETKKNTEKVTEFVPLDGQQRLTTLFLLHWFLYQISENMKLKTEFKNHLLKDEKSMFTYETRTSSAEFCDALMGNDIDFSKLICNSLSKTIENSPWFFLSWKSDPTIQSMLTMLDAIHGKFANKKEYFERLLNTENPIITFLFLNLKDFKLTDDLYIKMNSRGKPLTSFENFKAKFEQHLEGVKTGRKFKLISDGKERDVSLKEYFAYNIDTKWADLFWAYREIAGDDNVYDEELKNFIRVIFTNQYAISNVNDDSFEFLLGTQPARRQKDYTDDISFYKYDELRAITEESILYLIDAFDRLVNGNKKINPYLSDKDRSYFNENETFEEALKLDRDFDYPKRVLFHAYIRFLVTNKDDTSGIKQWLRVISNLANNSTIDGADEFSKAIKSIERLLPQSNNILKLLRENVEIDFFSGEQKLEERIKAHLIIKNEKWKEKIENTEKLRCFKGQIGFILEFAGIVDFYEKNKNCDWTEQENSNFFNLFKEYADKAAAVFNNKTDYDKDYVWERAVLTKGEYLIDVDRQNPGNSWKKNLLSSGENTRDFSWTRLLRITDKHKDKRQFVKQVFDDKLFDKTDVRNSLERICKTRTGTWRDCLIECPCLIKYCKQGFVGYKNDTDIILLGQSQMNHYHAEMYSFFLWKQFIKPRKEEFKSFKNIEYCDVKSSEEYAHIVLNDFCHNRIYYEINIYYRNNDNLPNPYEIAFTKAKGENTPDKYGDEIKNILANLNFEWNEEYSGFFFTSKNKEELLEKLEKINKELQNI